MKIEVTESTDKSCPRGMKWAGRYSPGKVEYVVRWDRGYCESPGTSHCATLTEARREARGIVREGRKWAEVFRWAESGVQIRRVFICSYEKGLNHGN